MGDKVQLAIQTDTNKVEIKEHEIHFQEVCDTFKKPNLRIHGVEDGTEVKVNGLDRLLNEIIAESYPIYPKK